MARFSADFIDHVSARLDSSKLAGTPMRKLLTRWLDKVRDVAHEKAPKDTGAMADSLKPYVSGGEFPKSAGIRSDSRKIAYVHGRFAIPAPPVHRSVPHFPPATQSLRAWANRHGIPVILVQKSIAEHGTPIVPFLAQAVDEMLPRLDDEVDAAEREIERTWNA